MSDQEKNNLLSASAIADALRAKREKKSASQADMAALEASLLADLDSFDENALNLAEEPRKPLSAPAAVAGSNPFPQIVPDHLAQAGNQRPGGGHAAAQAAGASMPTPSVPGSGLLAQLRQQAQQVIQENDATTKRQASNVQALDGALRRLFDYVNELVQQLNVIHPVVERTYSLFGNIEFANLVWQRGFADYRTGIVEGGAVFESVMMSFNLKASKELVIEKEASAIEGLRKILYDNGIVFRCVETLNQRRMIERATFILAPEIKTTLRWRAVPENNAILLEARNFERFGDLRYFFAPEALDAPMFDEFGRLLLGHANRFRDYIRR